jgi:ribosome maturation factor RimP
MEEALTIKKWVEEFLDQSLFVVDVSIAGAKGHQKLRISLDGDKGVTIDQCATVSRKLAARLDAEDLIKDAYQLEVSSAGIDQPLKMLRQYQKNVGRQVKVALKNGKEEKGALEAVSEKDLTLKKALKKKETELITISFEDIQHTKVLITF